MIETCVRLLQAQYLLNANSSAGLELCELSDALLTAKRFRSTVSRSVLESFELQCVPFNEERLPSALSSLRVE